MQSFNIFGLPVENESVSNVTATNSVIPGTKVMYKGEDYLYVYNAGAQQILPGQAAVLSANSGFSVTVSSVTMYDFPLGVCKHATITTGAYGWLLTRGFANVNFASNTGAAINDVLMIGAQGNFAAIAAQISFVCGQALSPLGYMVSAAATIGASTQVSGLAYVQLYG